MMRMRDGRRERECMVIIGEVDEDKFIVSFSSSPRM